MKKLIFAAVVAAMAMGANAGYTIDWGTLNENSRGASGSYMGNGSSDSYTQVYVYKGVAEIVDVAGVKTFSDASLDLLDSKMIDSNRSSSIIGKTINSDLFGGAEEDYSLVIVSAIVDGNKDQATLVNGGSYAMYIYNGISSLGQDGHLKLFDANRSYVATDFTKGVTYTTAAIPEPTSALLMLLGMAGLALKRKVA